MLQNSTIQTALSSEQSTAGYDLFPEVSDDDDCSCSTVYSVGDISSITGANDDVACIDDIQECDYESEDTDDTEETTVNTSTGTAPEQLLSTVPISPGYVLVVDNINLNVRRSNQRIGRTTNSYHFCHKYALQNHVDSTRLADGPPSGALSPDVVLPNKEDLEKILSDFAVLVSR